MNSLFFAYALLGGLAIGLLISVYTDIRYRLILNKVTLPIALAAPLYWAATEGLSFPIIGYHLAIGAAVFA
ncbi:MAG: potassium:proton antiporter, partial [Sphingorhabdus sp.]